MISIPTSIIATLMERKITYRCQNRMSRFLHFILFTKDLQKKEIDEVCAK